MTVGNIVALTQTNVKRMLAYSSIAHTGYIMAGIAAFANAPDAETAAQGIEAVLFYVLGYAVMNIAAFAVVAMLQRDTTRFGGLASFAGLRRAPRGAAAMAVLMLSLTGIPPTVGFFAKLYVLLATVESGLDLAGGGHRPQRRARRVLLPARHRLHVHAGSRARSRARSTPRRSARWPWPSRSPA